jgi:hypothetical protein
MKTFICLALFSSLSALAAPDPVHEFLKTHPIDASGSYQGLNKRAYIDVSVRSQNVHAQVDYIHLNPDGLVISLLDVSIIKSYEPLILAPYPVYSTIILAKSELEKRGQKFQSYGAISTEEGNGFCRSAFGPEYHLSKQNPTASRKSEKDPWYLASVTCEGPKFTPPVTPVTPSSKK